MWESIVGTAGLGSALQGIGSLAGAWGQYESGKESNKLKKQQLEYEKSKDVLANSKLDAQQKSWDDAWSPLAPSLTPTATA